MATLINPFQFETPADDRWAFTDREDLTARLTEILSERARRVLVFGRRRMGKTSLLKHVGARSRQPWVYCDVAKAASAGELARKLMAAAPAAKGAGLARALEIASKHFKTVAVEAGKIVLRGELRAETAAESIEGVLNVLNERAADRDEVWTVCLDELQEIRTLLGDRADWQLRAFTQELKCLNFIFTGSDYRLLKWMTEHNAPFFKQLEQIEVGPIAPAHLSGWIEEKARIGGLAKFPYGSSIVKMAGPCTGDIIRLARSVFTLAGGHRDDHDPVTKAFGLIALVEHNSEFSSQWRLLSVGQRSVLRALADGKQAASAETLRSYGIGAASTATSAIEALIERQLLVREGSRVIFDSPYFCRWVGFNGEN